MVAARRVGRDIRLLVLVQCYATTAPRRGVGHHLRETLYAIDARAPTIAQLAWRRSS